MPDRRDFEPTNGGSQRTVDLGPDRVKHDLNSSWRRPPATLVLSRDDVHVWRATLDAERSYLKRLEETLSEERDRADRFYFEKHRDRFIVGRGLLRSILGRYLNVSPEDLAFGYGQYGKLALADPFAQNQICFNMSHSDGIALYAVTRGREVGIDIERQRADFATKEIAERFFSPREVAALFALPDDVQSHAFFSCWTRKEAYIKARGMGLSLPLDQFDVSLAPGEPAALLYTSGEPTEASRWCLQELIAGPGYAAALAVAGQSWQLKCWQAPTGFAPGY